MATDKDATRLEELFERGRSAFSAGRLGEAEELFRAALDLDPTNAAARAVPGRCGFRAVGEWSSRCSGVLQMCRRRL